MPDAPSDPRDSTPRPAGLTAAEAARRLKDEGPNLLPEAGHRGILGILRDVVKEPMLALLLAGGVIYLIFGDLAEALILVVFASFSILVTTVQERRTERILERLRDLTSPRALVLRDGVPQRIAGRDVVRGDLLMLAEGDRVAADGWLVEGSELTADESLLTGESVPVGKSPAPARPDPSPRPGGEGNPMLYSGSLVTRGSGRVEVTATGPATEIGRIGQSLAKLDTEPPRLRAQTLRVVRIAGVLAILVSSVVVVLTGLARQDWLEGALSGIALAMALLPEEFPVVLTVFMAMGAWRISRARVLTRQAAAIESLGAATVLCTDKTGTLTENRMRVVETEPAAPTADLAETGRLASAPLPFDPMDRAFHEFAGATPAPDPKDLLVSFGLRPDLLAVTQIWQGADGGRIAACKGAPEAVARLCGLDAARWRAVEAQLSSMAERGLRVLALARADLAADAPLPPAPDGLPFRFIGLVGLADPLRAEVPQAIADCRAAGIRVVMITGDYPVTARAIATRAGLSAGRVLTGEDLARMADDDLSRAVADTDVFARIMPDQKLRLVTALKARGEVVAMTGDGVNDAPSLKAAHIGIAMGGRGTDVAREASAIVLLDDDFGSIVKAVRLGRRIYDNLRKAMGFIVALHLPVAALALLPLLLGMPPMLLPVHIAFLEMIIDPVCSLVFEAEGEEPDVMRRPPRDPAAPLFSATLLGWSALQGLTAALTVLAVYLWALRQGLPLDELRAVTFVALVLALMALILVNRSFSASPLSALDGRNPALVYVPLAVGAGLAVVLMVPFAARLFAFGPVHGQTLAMAAGAAAGLFLVLEIVKRFLGRRLAA